MQNQIYIWLSNRQYEIINIKKQRLWSQKRNHKKQRRNLLVALDILDIEGGGSVGEDQQIARLAHQFGGGLGLGPEETLHHAVDFPAAVASGPPPDEERR